MELTIKVEWDLLEEVGGPATDSDVNQAWELARSTSTTLADELRSISGTARVTALSVRA